MQREGNKFVDQNLQNAIVPKGTVGIIGAGVAFSCHGMGASWIGKSGFILNCAVNIVGKCVGKEYRCYEISG